MDTRKEYKPCPFCGSHAYLWQFHDAECFLRLFAENYEALLNGEKMPHDGIKKAQAWNMRHKDGE